MLLEQKYKIIYIYTYNKKYGYNNIIKYLLVELSDV